MHLKQRHGNIMVHVQKYDIIIVSCVKEVSPSELGTRVVFQLLVSV